MKAARAINLIVVYRFPSSVMLIGLHVLLLNFLRRLRFSRYPIQPPLLVSSLGSVHWPGSLGTIFGGLVGGLMLAMVCGFMFKTYRLKTCTCCSRSKSSAVAAPGGNSSAPAVQDCFEAGASSAAPTSSDLAPPPTHENPGDILTQGTLYSAVAPAVQYSEAAPSIQHPSVLPPPQ